MNKYVKISRLFKTKSLQDDKTTARNEPFKEAVEGVWNLANGKSKLVGVGVNCVDPKVLPRIFRNDSFCITNFHRSR